MGIYLKAPAPAGATSGTHYLMLQNTNSGVEYSKGNQAFGTHIQFSQSYWSSVSSYTPNDLNALQAVIDRLICGDVANTELNVRYYNGTDANQTGTREYQITVAQYKQLE